MILDSIDRAILKMLQGDGRMSNSELADRVGLSPSPCLRRVRLLEEAGYIRGYRAVVDRRKMGLGLTAFVGIKVERHHDAEATAFAAAVTALPEVVSCHLVSGEAADFLLEVVVASLEDYERLLTGILLKLPGVRDIRSTFAIRTHKADAPVPIPG